MANNLPAVWETWVWSLGWDGLLEEEGMATHCSILAWRIPWTEGDWWVAVHGVAKSQTQWSNLAGMHARSFDIYLFEEPPNLFPEQLHHFTSSPAMYKGSNYSLFLKHMLLLFYYYYEYNLLRFELMSYWGFDFPEDEGWWACVQCLVVICVSSLKKCLLKSFFYFFIGLAVFYNWAVNIP